MRDGSGFRVEKRGGTRGNRKPAGDPAVGHISNGRGLGQRHGTGTGEKRSG